MRPVWTALLALTLTAASSLAQAPKPHVVMLIAEREYDTDKSLSSFAKRHLSDRFRTSLVFAESNDPNRFQGIDAIEDADVLLVSVRRRTLPPEQLDLIRRYVAAGKPVIGIRTASHAFSLRGKDAPQGRAVWPEWDKVVFGGNYTNHHGNKLKVTVSFDSASSAPEILSRGIDRKVFSSGGSLYRTAPLAKGAKTLLMGRVEGHPSEPVAWTFQRSDGGKSFYTSLGHVDDFRGDVLPQLLINAIDWSTR